MSADESAFVQIFRREAAGLARDFWVERIAFFRAVAAGRIPTTKDRQAVRAQIEELNDEQLMASLLDGLGA